MISWSRCGLLRWVVMRPSSLGSNETFFKIWQCDHLRSLAFGAAFFSELVSFKHKLLLSFRSRHASQSSSPVEYQWESLRSVTRREIDGVVGVHAERDKLLFLICLLFLFCRERLLIAEIDQLLSEEWVKRRSGSLKSLYWSVKWAS